MMRWVALAMLLSAVGVPGALAQSALSTTGNVGSASLNNGYPGGGGVATLPAISPLVPQTSPITTGATFGTATSGGATTGPTGSGFSAAGGAAAGSAGPASSSGGSGTLGGGAVSFTTRPGARPAGSAAAAAPGNAAAGTSGAGSAISGGQNVPNWVICEPSGASGLTALFTGTSLSCAP